MMAKALVEIQGHQHRISKRMSKKFFKKKKSAITAMRLEVERKVAQVSADEKRAHVLADERRAQVLEEEEARERERVALEMIRGLDLQKDTFTDSSKGN
jgi:hypothetical protein